MNAHSSFIHSSLVLEKKAFKCPGKLIDRLWYISKVEYYSAIRKNELLILLILGVNLRNNVLSERIQTQNSVIC